MARRHMLMYGTTAEQLAAVAATDSQQRAREPGRGVLRARAVHGRRHPRVAHGGRSVPPARMRDDVGGRLRARPHDRGRANDTATKPVWILGGAGDTYGPAYVVPPVWDLRGRDDGIPAGLRRAARRAAVLRARRARSRRRRRRRAVRPVLVRDHPPARGVRASAATARVARSWRTGHIGPGGRIPVTTDGGTMSYSHAGLNVQMLQRVIRGVQQLRGYVRQQPGRRRRGRAVHRTAGRARCSTTSCCSGSERP